MHRLIEDYLGSLAREMEGIPAARQRELLEDVRGHIEEAWAASPDRSRAALLSILERLGEPEALAAEERERLGTDCAEPQQGPDLLSVAAIVLTALFWPLGVLLAWASPRWSTGDKAVATALPVLGLLLLLTTMMAASVAMTQGSEVASEVQVADQMAEGRPERATQRPPGGILSEAAPHVGGGVAVRFIGVGLALYGLFGAPFTAAIYLALRMRPRPRRGAALVPAVAAAMAAIALVALFLVSA